MSGLANSLRSRVFESYEGHGNIAEKPDTLCHEAADRIDALEDLLLWIRQHQNFHTLPHDIQVRVEVELPPDSVSAERFLALENTF